MNPSGPVWGAHTVRSALAAVLVLLCSAGFVAAKPQPPTSRADSATVPPANPERPTRLPMPGACTATAPAVWPATTAARRELIARLQRLRGQCMESADFLAWLGALVLDDGDPAEALIWLERALLLDPGNRGAQADHALVLAALGEPAALQELARTWQGRSDLPPALRAKLFPIEPRSAYALPNARLGYATRQTWGFQGGFSLVAGHETNLDRSPRLTALTLTFPEGPVVLPVLSAPRAGAAAQASGSLLWAYSPEPAVVIRSGFSVNLRTAPSERATDWHQAQWNSEATYTAKVWRVQVDASAASVSGALNEPYRLTRGGLSAEALGVACRTRLAIAREQRRQSMSTRLDATSAVWLAEVYCPLPLAPNWNLSLSFSHGRDRPESADRPGGPQHLQARAARLVGPLSLRTRLELNLRHVNVRDSTGYSALLNNNAVRRLSLHQYSIELSHPLDSHGWLGATAILQWQSAHQASNLSLFTYQADSYYAGLRWSW